MTDHTVDCPGPPSPISSGSNATQALRNSIDLAQQTERLGYARYWFAEHHLNPGVAGTSPAAVLGLTAAATSTIRLGSGAVQMAHRTALATVEEFGLLDALHPGRFDLGLGRSGGLLRETKAPALAGGGAAATVVGGRAPNDLLIPPRFSSSACSARRGSPCRQAAATAAGGAAELHRAGRRRAGPDRRNLSRPGGKEARVVPGEGAAVQVWILGSSGGDRSTGLFLWAAASFPVSNLARSARIMPAGASRYRRPAQSECDCRTGRTRVWSYAG